MIAIVSLSHFPDFDDKIAGSQKSFSIDGQGVNTRKLGLIAMSILVHN